MTPTDEQQAILTAARDTPNSLMIQALAGSGKTTTLTMLANALPPTTVGLALAFNKKIAEELANRFPPNFIVKTLNGLGHVAWQKALGKRCAVENNKIEKLTTEYFRELRKNGYEAGKDEWDIVRRMVRLAMTAGLVPKSFTSYKGLIEDRDENWLDLTYELSPKENHVGFARDILVRSIKIGMGAEGLPLISFDDQIYLSCLFHGIYPRFPVVLVDEAQDLSPLNLIQIKKCAAGRLLVVGDNLQAIYAFRGADYRSMERLEALRDDWIKLPLATTFRCPKAIVARVNGHAPGFKAFPSAPEGEIFDWRPKKDEHGEKVDREWSWADIRAGVTVLCRNNAPLLSLAFKLIRANVGVYMLGRDIGKGLVTLSRKILPNDSTEWEECRRLIGQWQDSEMSLAIANDQEHKLDSIEDRAHCLLAVLETNPNIRAHQLRSKLEQLFARENGMVILSSIHRAKGLEWSVVLHLDPWRIPSKWSRDKPDQMAQELNLRYVAETRTKQTLILANLEDYTP